ncbi:hypothetical protein [Bacillus wiedmannii]|uniref:hypothetical protein n=1 Tax=Bacillus wiedmannii TaxID=1890302 RepID=UPI000BEF7C1B|nr:hypothetical protein [Bacillus wiedmannii]PEM08487.1 hypothetical protein CN610_19735 [Bacillus wiedmannii]
MSLKDVVVTVQHKKRVTEKFMISLPRIRNLQGFLKGQWDLGSYDSCFPGRNGLGDIDAALELHGHTLMVEFKDNIESMNEGQLLRSVRQAKYSNITTIYVFGRTNAPNGYLMFKPDNYENPEHMPCSKDGLEDVLRRWAKWARENPAMTDEESQKDWDIVKRFATK